MSRFYIFGKDQKLKSAKAIGRLFTAGDKFKKGPFLFKYLKIDQPEPKAPYRFGVSCSKRNFRSAVKRNRIKRKLREAVRLERQGIINKRTGEYLLPFGFECMLIYLGKREDFELDKARAAVASFMKNLSS